MGNSHDRRKERRVKGMVNKTMEAMSADSSPLLPKETKLIRPGEAASTRGLNDPMFSAYWDL